MSELLTVEEIETQIIFWHQKMLKTKQIDAKESYAIKEIEWRNILKYAERIQEQQETIDMLKQSEQNAKEHADDFAVDCKRLEEELKSKNETIDKYSKLLKRDIGLIDDWRKVSEELPEPGEYNGYFEKYGTMQVCYNSGVWFNKFGVEDNPTHWKPIKAPKEE